MAGTSLAGDSASEGPAGLSCLCTLRFIKVQIKAPFGLRRVLLLAMQLCLGLGLG